MEPCISPVPDQGWAVKGFKTVGNNDRDDITIVEKGACISIAGDDGKTAYGIPIEADVAVEYIKNFIKNFTIIHKHKIFDFLENINSEKLLTEDNVTQIKDFASKTKGLSARVFQLNYGMTLDKSMALKILGQPKCEGLRFYLCSKGYPNVSLVAVGTDCSGKDLNYDVHETVTDSNTDSNTDPYSTQSLVGDYVTPPGSLELGSLFLNDKKQMTTQQKTCSKCFVLLQMAMNRIKPKKASKP